MLATFVLIPASVTGNLITSNEIITSRPLANINIVREGRVLNVKTTAPTVRDVLKQYKIDYGQFDRIEPSLDQSLNGGNVTVEIAKALPVLILDENQATKTFSGYVDPKDILKQHGIAVAPEDKIEASLVTDFAQDGWVGQKIQIRRAPSLTVKVDKSSLNLKSWSQTVGDVLSEKGIILGDRDKVLPGLDQAVTNGLEVDVIRVAESVVKKKTSIMRDTQYQPDYDLFRGQEAVADEGEDGLKEEVYKVVFENGKVVSQHLVATEVIKSAKPRIIKKGRKPGNPGIYWPILKAAGLKYGIQPEDLHCVMSRESGGNPYATDVTGLYVGLFQWELSSWKYYASLAGFGGASRTNPEAQIYATALRVSKAIKLGNSDPWGPWPNTARSCGLR